MESNKTNTKLKIYGKKIDNPVKEHEDSDMDLEAVYQIIPATRGDDSTVNLDLKNDNLIQFEFEDSTVWLSSPESMHELFPEINLPKRDIDAPIDLTLRDDAAQSRGIIKNIALKVIKVFTKKLVNPIIGDLAHDLENKQLENNIGLFKLGDGFKLIPGPIAPSSKPYLLFIHGTASSTDGSFGKLEKDKNNTTTEQWKKIRSVYGENVIAFNHRTLTESPLENIKQLFDQLPKGATLHLVSHSRGGLVGDVFSRFCVAKTNYKGFSADEIHFLSKNGRQTDIDNIGIIAAKAADKRINVEKFIRVACPASGTTLATTRLDHLLNIMLNLLGIATAQNANPIYIAFKNLLAAVVETKNDPKVLPGLEVQNPDSPFNEMLNNPTPETIIESPLYVISGNSQFSLRWKGLLVITTKLFFMGKNDFVVDTRSMYNGAKRGPKNMQYYFDESPETSHFDYFLNNSTRKALQLAIENDGKADIPGFSRMVQVSTGEEIRNAVLKLQKGEEFRENVTGKRPIAVMLPGIMGSNLIVDGDRVWINYLRFFTGGLSRLVYSDNNTNVNARSLIETSYTKLADYLESEKYDVVTFPFDWRQSLTESAEKLNQKLKDLMKFGQPIKLIGHSMGGVLIRDFIINHTDTWEKLNTNPDFKLLFLGSPLGGSFRISYVMFGEDDIIKSLGKADLTRTRKELLSIFNNMPGLLCLLPLTKGTTTVNNAVMADFSLIDTWKDMVGGFTDKSWPLPPVKALDEFKAYRDNVLGNLHKLDYKNSIYIAGQSRPDHPTPYGYRMVNGNLQFLFTKEGDESVTWETGIPQKMIADGNVYYSDVQHGELANERRLFRAIADVLAKGSTTLLKKTRPALRSTETELVTRPTTNYDMSEGGIINNILGMGTTEGEKSGALPVSVSVCHGDLRYARHLVLAGHFYNDGLFSAERSLNEALNDELERRRTLGLYPGEIGSSEFFINNNKLGLKGAIIAGLGKSGELTAFQLTKTVEQAITRYLASYNSEHNNDVEKTNCLGISTLAIGSGYGGLTVEGSIRAIIQGVQNANEKIKQLYPTAAIIDEIEFIELFQDKALSTIKSLQQIEKDENHTLNIVWKLEKLKKLPGRSERIAIDNTNEWWTRIKIRKLDNGSDGCKCEKNGFAFTMSTNAAREEERYIFTSMDTIVDMLNQMSEGDKWNPAIAKTIFELLIPHDFKDQLKKQNNICWLLDNHSASIPWELLHDGSKNSKPLSVNAGMIRQLETKNYRVNINSINDPTALVIGDPNLEGFFSQLPGALEEAQKVAEIIRANRFEVTDLYNDYAANILQAMFSKSYKIIHLAAHGTFNADPKLPTGMLIGKNAFLTPADICQMSAVPELVFANCCYLGKMDGTAEALAQSKFQLAANIGTGLIDNGVKAVIVAGWAVDDAAGLAFAKKFYELMFGGYTFGEALQQSRQHIYEKYDKNNTWGAYQCYGDPFYKLIKKEDDEASIEYEFAVVQEAEIKLSNLNNKLETGSFIKELAVQSLNAIDAALKNAKLAPSAKVLELQAMIYSGLNMYPESVAKFEELLKSKKATFSVEALEKYANVRTKLYVSKFKVDPAQASSLVDDAKKVIVELKFLTDHFGNNSERNSLIGSAYKRIGIMQTGNEKIETYKYSASSYFDASVIDKHNNFYSLTNWLTVENALALANVKTWKEVALAKKKVVEKLVDLLKNNEIRLQAAEEIDYWDYVAEANLKLCLYLIDEKHITFEQVEAAYLHVWNYAGNYGNKQAEIEHFEFLEDIHNISDEPRAVKIKTMITNLKEKLRANM